MKPSERRALEAEKRAVREAAERERELTKAANKKQKDGFGSQSAATQSQTADERERVDPNAPYLKLKEEEIETRGDGYHKEGFFGSHIRLITFIITLTLVVTVLAPWGIDALVKQNRKKIFGEDVSNKKDLTVESMLTLADLGMNLRWKHLADYNYSDFSYEFKDDKTGKKHMRYVREYSINEDLSLKVGGYDLDGVPDMAQLIDYQSGELLTDIRKENVSGFLAERGY